jgi:hypothetical protein
VRGACAVTSRGACCKPGEGGGEGSGAGGELHQEVWVQVLGGLWGRGARERGGAAAQIMLRMDSCKQWQVTALQRQ